MTESEAKQRLDQTIKSCLSGITPDPFLYQRVRLRKERPIMKRKITIVSITLVMLLMMCATALAIGIYESIKPAMDQAAAVSVGSDWELSDKLKLISIISDYGLIDEQDSNLAICLNESETEETRNSAAAMVIDAVYGDLIRADRDPSILQQEIYPKPSLEDVFTIFYRSQVPDADDNTIMTEYERWFTESNLFIPADDVVEQPIEPITSEDAVLEIADSMLSEIYNFNKAERAATKISATFDQNNEIWIVSFYVKASDLRTSLRAERTTYDYDAAQDAYIWTKVLLSNGQLTDASSAEEYEWDNIIPREGYPNWDVWEDDYRAFLYCTAEERAAFSAQYKPIVDSFIDQHPAIREYYETHDGGTAYQITRHIYGIPNAGAISEDDALQIAFAAWQASGVDGVKPGILDDRRSYYCLYDVSDPDKPVWKVSMQYVYDHIPDQSMNFDGFFVVIDAHTGEILKQYIQSGPDGMTQYCDSAYKYAEMFL